jgi:hypothetical protein
VSISAYCRRRRRRPSRSTAAPPLIRVGGEAPIFYIVGCLVVGALFLCGRNLFCFSCLADVVIVILYAFRLILVWSGFVFVQMVMMSNWFVFFRKLMQLPRTNACDLVMLI